MSDATVVKVLAGEQGTKPPPTPPDGSGILAQEDGGNSPPVQNRLYWIAALITFLLIGLFFGTSYVQLQRLHTAMSTRAWAAPALPPLDFTQTDVTPEHILAIHSWDSLVMLETYAYERRYHQANILLMSRVWIQYIGFIVGMILALMGGTFIIGKLREPAVVVIGKAGDKEISWQGSSPGMYLAGLGVLLMLTTIVINHKIEITEQPLFVIYGDVPGMTPSLLVTEGRLDSLSEEAPAPPLDPLPTEEIPTEPVSE